MNSHFISFDKNHRSKHLLIKIGWLVQFFKQGISGQLIKMPFLMQGLFTQTYRATAMHQYHLSIDG